MNLMFIFRKYHAFSIEKVFSTIITRLDNFGLTNKIIKLPSERNGLLGMIQNVSFIFLIRIRDRNSIFHVTGDNHYLSLFLPSSRTILTIHDNIKMEIYSGYKRKIVSYLWLKWPVKKLKYITTISQKTKDEIVSYTKCNDKKISIIYNPLNQQYFYAERNFNLIKPVILHIGTRTNKNLENLISAIEGLSVCLYIVGPLTEIQFKLLQQCRIDFSNYISLTDSEILSIYKEADIVSFITTYEGFGMPIIEGQAIGRVVITSNIEPHKEIAGNGAMFVDPLDPIKIRECFMEIIRNAQLREKLINSGLENIKRFAIDKIVEDYLSLYHNVSKSPN